MHRNTTFLMYLPDAETAQQQREIKTLFLLHGFAEDAHNWVPRELSDKYGFAVVIPNGENAFWLDRASTGHKYCTMLGEELVGYLQRVFALAQKREDTYIMGLSMGGFGALHTAFYYPNVFSKVTALSSALITGEVAKMQEGVGNSIANYEYYKECFGEPSQLKGSDNDPEELVRRIIKNGSPMPEIFMSCGTEDFLLEKNREFHSFLNSRGVKHIYEEDRGGHDMDFWQRYVRRFIPLMFAASC